MKTRIVRTCSLTIAAAAAAFGQVPDFLAPAVFPTGGSSAYVAVADFNRDNIPDIVTYESAIQSLSILIGKPDGTFQPPLSRALGFAVNSIAAADLNGDGAADLVLSGAGGIAVLLNGGDGSFAPARFYSAGIAPNFVVARDLNHDGVVDLVAAGVNGLSLLRGLGAGTFSAPLILPDTFAHYWVGVADFNGDGNPDLIGDGSPSQFYAGNGDGTFAPPINTIPIPYGAVIGDFNGDGKMDIAYLVNTFNRERVAGQQISYLMGTGTGQFLDAMDFFFPGTGSGQVAAGDFKGTGGTDLAIWLTSPARLFLMIHASSQLASVPVDLNAVGNASLTAADVDGNGSRDLLLLNPTTATLLRNTHGNPPLLALTAVAPASVIGGVMTQGTVTLGGPAPAAGATVTLSSSNPALAHPVVPTVTVPPGASAATFQVSTAAVSGSASVSITATCNSVTQTANLTLVAPYALTGLTVNPASQFGGFTAQGTVVLSGAADSAATVFLSSSNGSLVSLPASVTVPAGAASASFPIILQPVTADVPVSIFASTSGATQTAGITILRPLDSVQTTKAEYTSRSLQLKVEATSTNSAASLTVWNAGTGALIGSLVPAGGGKYTGSFTVSPAVLSISVKSSLGGIATGPVAQK
jgi:hypothetical protein